MPFRFRKSFGSKAFRINVGKRGVGFSTGVGPVRFSTSSRGSQVSMGIPGTGLSWYHRIGVGSVSGNVGVDAVLYSVVISLFLCLCMIVFVFSARSQGGGNPTQVPAVQQSTRPAAPAAPVVVPPASGSDHPAGTSGKCKDGTYTKAKHKQGACSSHGGVMEWWGQ